MRVLPFKSKHLKRIPLTQDQVYVFADAKSLETIKSNIPDLDVRPIDNLRDWRDIVKGKGSSVIIYSTDSNAVKKFFPSISGLRQNAHRVVVWINGEQKELRDKFFRKLLEDEIEVIFSPFSILLFSDVISCFQSVKFKQLMDTMPEKKRTLLIDFFDLIFQSTVISHKLPIFMKVLRKLFEASHVSFMKYDRYSGVLRIVAHYGDTFKKINPNVLEIKPGERIAGWAFQVGDGIFIKNGPEELKKHFGVNPNPDIKWSVVLPIKYGGQKLGVINISGDKQNPPPYVVKLAEFVAVRLGMALWMEYHYLLRNLIAFLLNEIPRGIIVFETTTQTVIFANPYFINMQNRFVFPFRDITPGNRAEKALEVLREWNLREDFIEVPERGSDERRYLEVIRLAFSLIDENYEVFIINSPDIISKLMKMKKMELLEAMKHGISGIQHNINNPLAYISSNVDYIEEISKKWLKAPREHIKESELQDVVDMIQEVKHGVSRIRNLVHNVGEFLNASKKAERIKQFCLVELLDEVINDLKEKFTESDVKVTWEHKCDRSSCIITGDQDLLKTAFREIFKNAFEEVKGDGTVTVEATHTEREIVVKITDTGRGITSEQISKIYMPFYTTKHETEKYGLGFSTAYSIITAHGGDIEVSGRSGSGTQITVKLPKPVRTDINTISTGKLSQ